MMIFFAVLFVGFIIILAFYLNSLLDKREERKAGKSVRDRRGAL